MGAGGRAPADCPPGHSLERRRGRVQPGSGVFRLAPSPSLLLLSSLQGLRVLSYCCERAMEHTEHHPEGPLRIWEFIEREIRWGGEWEEEAAGQGLSLYSSAIAKLGSSFVARRSLCICI